MINSICPTCFRPSSPKTRGQFLQVDHKLIYAFVQNGAKFAQCQNYIDRTCEVKCKVHRLIYDFSKATIITTL